MNIKPGAENLAPHTRRDYTPDGVDGTDKGTTILGSIEALDLLAEAHKDRAMGRTSVVEWRSIQRDLISRTVPGATRSVMERALGSLTIAGTASVQVPCNVDDPALVALSGV